MENRDIRKVVVTGGAGAVGGAYVRALVPGGYDVKAVSSNPHDIKVFGELGHNWVKSSKSIEDVLLGAVVINPLDDLGQYIQQVDFEQVDLSDKSTWKRNPFLDADVAILTSGNGNPEQSRESAMRNYQIDKNSIDAVVEANAKIIIYTASNWRTMNLIGKNLIDPENDEDPPPSHYAQMKAASVRYLKEVAANNEGIIFIYNDHCWYPRETFGAPPSNLSGEALQFWVAECETQMHIMKELKIRNNYPFKQQILNGKNVFGFNVVSRNEPGNRAGQPPFSYDLTKSRDLGVMHQFNIYKVLENGDYSWRRIPIVMK